MVSLPEKMMTTSFDSNASVMDSSLTMIGIGSSAEKGHNQEC